MVFFLQAISAPPVSPDYLSLLKSVFLAVADTHPAFLFNFSPKN